MRGECRDERRVKERVSRQESEVTLEEKREGKSVKEVKAVEMVKWENQL